MAKKTDRGARESRIASGWTVESETAAEAVEPMPAETVESPADPESPIASEDGQFTAQAPAQRGSGTLIMLGVIGGLYLIYTVVWFSWANHYSQMNALIAEGSGAIGGVLQQLVFWASPLAPVLWFLSVLVLNRGASSLRIALWLLLGAVVLVPLPMLSFGGAS